MISKEERDNIIDFIDSQPEVKKKTNGRRNKQVGNSYELNVAKALRERGFPHVITTRLGSRLLDSQKVDLMNKDEHIHGRFPYNIQCKCLAKLVQYGKILEEMPKGGDEVNVIIHKQTKKVGDKFMPRGEFAIMKAEDWYEMIAEIEHWRQQYAKNI